MFPFDWWLEKKGKILDENFEKKQRYEETRENINGKN